jgi:biopolymer transport protein ExbD
MSRRGKSDEEVTLNVTAMLDMAFQLLAFFVLTFRPPPAEAQIFLKLPPNLPVQGQGKENAGENTDKKPEDIKPVKTLIVSLMDNDANGSIADVRIGIGADLKQVPYNELEGELKDWIQKQGFEQIVVQSSATLHWEEVMKVFDMCATIMGKESKVSFVCVGERREE